MNCLLIYNPHSGTSRRLTRQLNYIKSKLCSKFDQIDIQTTKHEGHATEIAADACGKYDYLILAGGDGTFHEVINGVAEKKNSPIIGYIPCGTVCDMAKNLKMSRSIRKSVKLILSGDVVDYDVCKANDRYFIYVAAVGGYSAISYGLKSKSKKVLGKLAYLFNGIRLIFKTKNNPMHIKVTTPEKTYEGEYSYFIAANSTSIGGFRLNEQAKLNDGKIDIFLFKKSFLNGVPKIIKMFAVGTRVKDKYIEKITTNKCDITIDEDRAWNMDGEEGIKGSAKIKVLKKNIKVIVAKSADEEWF